MNYIYFDLDKNPRQLKKITLGKYEIVLRIEWNTRSKSWYVLGYIGEDLVLRNTKITMNQFYRFDVDSGYYLPYMFTIFPDISDYAWNTKTTMIFCEDDSAFTFNGLTSNGQILERSIATSSDTHSKTALRSDNNLFLFDLSLNGKDQEVIIICDGAGSSFITVGIPQGRWDFTINGLKTSFAIQSGDITKLNSYMMPYGVTVELLGDNRYIWSNLSTNELKIDAVYPYSDGYPFFVETSSNSSLIVQSEDPNGYVNRFTVCMGRNE